MRCGRPPSSSAGSERVMLTTGHVKGPPMDAFVEGEEEGAAEEVDVRPLRLAGEPDRVADWEGLNGLLGVELGAGGVVC